MCVLPACKTVQLWDLGCFPTCFDTGYWKMERMSDETSPDKRREIRTENGTYRILNDTSSNKRSFFAIISNVSFLLLQYDENETFIEHDRVFFELFEMS